MKLRVNDINVHVHIWNEQADQTIVMLHGFTGSVSTWGKIADLLPKTYRIIAIDLIGHGLTDAPEDVSNYWMEEQITLLHETFKQLNLSTYTLLGYSMGGRVALSYAATYPSQIEQLILESASPGLKTEHERQARRLSDDELANKIMQNGVQSFVEKWENISLFESQKKLPKEVQAEIRQERLAQCEIGLANSLRGMGTGSQQSLWTKLVEIDIPVTLITGTLDQKFCNIAQEMKKLLLNAKHVVVHEVGHAIHVENPTTFATIVKDVINK
ncbi:2-succinyl-6-hydroxy-2,4-cyclohexadiene-1-carboxylate synthase [Lysinibacillus antri]|uniref:Putative 2-succinyl-6-hydroxy-2,4-cyclohexadiene-1-carboxylate synthase n=1 Tax=Lysinibacillus antri TaxID=2498145 RepID=A0A432LFX8_9BACI|nr:2-succinyl-6-hydroxy-2,4-cyclohexadiene-1-carboxylate synthase [Lysinibacillus antri]RUL56560.1 2-succinyl-6-hydroxy-2,4-cyclohexadiene-1-carboxylate synthase [Lysinibacillus antri]